MDTNAAEKLLRETDDFRDATHLVEVDGMSSPKVCNLLNRLVASMGPDEHYLEIGTWKGRTLLSAAHGNLGRLCFGCDKIRLWGRFTGFGFEVRRSLLANVARHRGRGAEVKLFLTTSRELFARHLVPCPVGVYFYDGGHTYAETHHGIVSAAPILSRRAVILVDDWNDPAIRRATFDGFEAARLDMLWGRHLQGDHDENGWWNGLGVFYVQKR
jgi:hypothetical protein